ncbi:MAG: pyridoxal phosphate-dependent aminotransferase [Chloroflexi bacterium]|nr:pyridoxal phosphate-dependent aminotransferase [Chloroflexota bacterium]
MSARQVQDIVALARHHDIWLLSDECYDQFVYDGEHVSPLRYADQGTIGVFSFSKTFAMTGWRCGYMVVPASHFAATVDAHLALNSVTASISQMAALAGLRQAMDQVEMMRRSYQQRRDQAVALLMDLKLLECIPRGAFYLWLNISRCGLDSYTFAKRLLDEERVAVAPGSAFGTGPDHYVRISLATEESQLLEGIARTGEFVSRHTSP